MLALRKTAAGPGLDLQQVPEPARPRGSQVLLQVVAAGICGSDLHLERWGPGYAHLARHLPVTLGHEFSARVLQCGPDVVDLAEGDLVAPMPAVACGACPACTAGKPWVCTARRALGVSLDGGFAPRVLVPAANCVRLPEGIDPQLAALLEPLAIGDNAAQVAEVGPGDTVVVLGPGTIGQAACRAARWRGATAVVAVGFDDAPRLATARALGATHGIDLADGVPLAEALRAQLGGRGIAKVIEATGAAASLAEGLALLQDEGIFVSVGIHAQPVPIDMSQLVRRRLQLRGAYSSKRPAWEALARRIAEEPDAVRPMVSHVLPLSRAVEGFALCRERQASKVLLLPSSMD